MSVKQEQGGEESVEPIRRRVKAKKRELLEEFVQAGNGWSVVRPDPDDGPDAPQVLSWALAQLVEERLIIKGKGSYQITMEGVEAFGRPAIDPAVEILNAIVIALRDRHGGYVDRRDIVRALNLKVDELSQDHINHIHDSVEVLEGIGAVKVLSAAGTAPFRFSKLHGLGLMIRDIAQHVEEGWDADEYIAHELRREQRSHIDQSQTITIENSASHNTFQVASALGDVSQVQSVHYSPFEKIEDPSIYQGHLVHLMQGTMNDRQEDGSHADMIKLLSYLERVDVTNKTSIDVARECVAHAQNDGMSMQAIKNAFHYYKHMENWPVLAQGIGVNLAFEVLKMVVTALAMGM